MYYLLVQSVMCAYIWDPNMEKCAFAWTHSLLWKHSTFHSSSSPEPRMGSEHCCSSKNYQPTCEVWMAMKSPKGRADTPCVRSGHPHSFCSNESCFLHSSLPLSLQREVKMNAENSLFPPCSPWTSQPCLRTQLTSHSFKELWQLKPPANNLCHR